MENNKRLILKELREHLGYNTDTEFATFLGIAQNTISGWKSRNTLDYDLIIQKVDNINANWLLRGTGSMLLTQGEPEESVSEPHSLPKKDLELQDLKHLMVLNSRTAEAERRELMIQCRTIELAMEEVLLALLPSQKLEQVRDMLDKKATFAREEYHSKSMTGRSN